MKIHSNIKVIAFIIAIFVYAPAYAEQPPIPQIKPNSLNVVENKLEDEKTQKTKLSVKVKKTKLDLRKTKQHLIETAQIIQNNEGELKRLEQRIVSLEIKESIIKDKLNADRSSIIKLILALEKIRRTPPEAMLARPDTPYKTAQSAMLMSGIIPSLNRHASSLNKNLETLQRVTGELTVERDTLLETSGRLKVKHEELSLLMIARRNLFERTNKDLQAREISVQKISLQAKSLRDLIKKTKEEEIMAMKRQKANLALHSTKQELIDSGAVRLPISGIIRVGYNQKDALGAKSNGLTIEGRTGGIVVSPMDGRVQFSGPFKRYGNIIIIEHAGGFHSLIAGLSKINGVVGDVIKSGEPVGILPDSSLIPRPTLYYELRRGGQPVNPSVKFADLG